MRFAVSSIVAVAALLSAAPSPNVTLELRDYVEFPVTGLLDGKGQTDGMLARVNALREEPGGANRFFIHDPDGNRIEIIQWLRPYSSEENAPR